MILARLRMETSNLDGRSYATGTTNYAIPKGTIVMIKRDPDDPEQWVLWAIEPRKPRTEVSPAVFTGPDSEAP